MLDAPPVRLRPFAPADAGLVVAAGTDPLIPLITTVRAGGTLDDARAFIERQHERLRTGAGYSFAVADAGTDEAVGHFGVWLRDHDQGRVNVGYWIGAAFRRRGYARAALGTATRWALRLPGVYRVELYVEPWNQGSWRTAERVGYRREGLLRGWQRVGTERRDMYMYAVLPGDAGQANPSR